MNFGLRYRWNFRIANNSARHSSSRASYRDSVSDSPLDGGTLPIPLCFLFTNFVHLNFPSDIRNLSSCMSYCTPLNLMSWKCLAPSICCHIGILFLSSGLKYCFYLTKSEKGFFSYFVLFHLCIHRYSINMKCEIDETIQNLYSNKIHDLLWL